MVRNRAWGPFLAAGLSVVVFGDAAALGLGPLRTQSALNQPFYAEIDLLDVDPAELDAVRARLAGTDEFDKAGAERPHFLTGLRFTPMVGPAGQAVVQVTSREPVREPFLDFLIEVVWPDGRLVKEYAVLLDPPALTADTAPPVSLPGAAPTTRYPSPQPHRRPQKTLLPAPQPPQAREEPVAEPASRSDRRDGPSAESSRPPPLPTPAAIPDEARATRFPLRYGPVRSGDGLWRIARRLTPPGATIAQTAMAAYRNSPSAFADGDINLLKLGSELLIPSAEELFALDAATADRQFRNAMAGRAVIARPLTDVPQDSELRIVTAPAEDDGVPSREGGERPADPQPDTLGELEEDLLLVREASETNRQEATELRGRIQELEQQLSDIRRLLELRNEQLVQLQSVLRESEDAVRTIGPPSPGASDQPASLSAVDETIVAAEPQANPPFTTRDPSAVDSAQVTDGPSAEAVEPVVRAPETPRSAESGAGPMPHVVLGAAAVVPLLGALGWLVLARRRRQRESEGSEGLAAEPGLPSPTSVWQGGQATADTGLDEVLPVSDAGAAWHSAPARSSASDVARAPEAVEQAAAEPRWRPDSVALQEEAARRDTRWAQSRHATSGAEQTSAAQPDPLAEADIYVLYGRYREAERILSDELHRSPGRVDLRYKLAEALLGSGNREALASLLEQMTTAGEDRADPARFAAIERRWAERRSRGSRDAAADNDHSAPAPVEVRTPGASEPPRDAGDITLDLDVADRRGGLEERGGDESVLGFSVEEISPESADSLRIHFKELEEGLFELDGGDVAAERRGGEAISPGHAELAERAVAPALDRSAQAPDAPLRPDERASGDPLAEPSGWSAEWPAAEPSRAGEDELDLDLAALERLSDRDGPGSPSARAAPDGGGDAPLDARWEAELGRAYAEATASIEATVPGQDADDAGTDPSGATGASDDSLPSQWPAQAAGWDEIAIKMDLARAYIEMDDLEAARAILGEVVEEGDGEQQAEAKALLAGLA
jgi:pilus assembly protein FimV